jgi:LacI family transcriptional regulator/LacI family asc operon transcriptional repressor
LFESQVEEKKASGFAAMFLQGTLPITGLILNILLYYPLGYLLPILFPKLKPKHVILIGCLCSIATEATQYLLDTGRKNILYLYHSKNYNGQKKLAGYRAALESRGVPVNEQLIRFFSDEKYNVPTVRDQLLALRESGLVFDAVQTSEDVLAIGAVKYAKAAKLSVPKNLSIVGYNNSSFCLCSEPEITSVDNKLQAVSEQCVSTMMGVLEGREMPQKIVFTGELIKRDSTL